MGCINNKKEKTWEEVRWSYMIEKKEWEMWKEDLKLKQENGKWLKVVRYENQTYGVEELNKEIYKIYQIETTILKWGLVKWGLSITILWKSKIPVYKEKLL